MPRYTYRDKRQTPPVIVLSVLAETILEADKLYKEAGLGDVAKQPYVGCERTEGDALPEDSTLARPCYYKNPDVP
jgi:hypothetical protein